LKFQAYSWDTWNGKIDGDGDCQAAHQHAVTAHDAYSMHIYDMVSLDIFVER